MNHIFYYDVKSSIGTTGSAQIAGEETSGAQQPLIAAMPETLDKHGGRRSIRSIARSLDRVDRFDRFDNFSVARKIFEK